MAIPGRYLPSRISKDERLFVAINTPKQPGRSPLRSNPALRHLTLPTDPEVIDALVRGTADWLTLRDEVGGEDLSKAA